MKIISTNPDLQDLCTRFAHAPFVAVDTEFMREGTYWSELCLIQIATANEAVIIDPLAEGIDLSPFMDLMANPNVVKVFHAARQDVEIFVQQFDTVPIPLFDTQIAAMAAGFGEQVSYEALAKAMVKAKIDKASRFTNWARRPLKDSQLKYALDDVIHLAALYPKLRKRLEDGNRLEWIAEDLEILTNPRTYDMIPDQAWRRLRLRRKTTPYLAALKAAAAWRERTAQANNKPRNRILRDEALEELAMNKVQTIEAMNDLRAVPKGFGRSKWGPELAACLADALADPEAYAPDVEFKGRPDPIPPAKLEMLKVLLKIRSDEIGVASKLIATASDLEAFARGEQTFTGWRHEVFGRDAERVLAGEIAFRLRGETVEMVELSAHA